MIKDILAGIPWGIFLSFMIGPVFFILLETSIIKGFRAALVFDLGVILGDIFFAVFFFLTKDKPYLKLKLKIYINGKKITHKRAYTVDKIRNLNMGYIFQDYKLINDYTIEENIMVPLKINNY